MSEPPVEAQLGKLLADQLPAYVRRVLLISDTSGDFLDALMASGTIAVDTPATMPGDSPAYDVVCGLHDSRDALDAAIAEFKPRLHLNGLWALVHYNADGGALDQAAAESAFSDHGLLRFNRWDVTAKTGNDDATPAGYVLTAVHDHYDPVAHARALFDGGHPAWSYDALARVPEDLLVTPEARAAVKAEMQLCLLAWDRIAPPTDRLNRFYLSQAHFYEAVSEAPGFRFPYTVHAEFWRSVGDESMARRLLHTYDYLFEAPCEGRAFDPVEPTAPTPDPPRIELPDEPTRLLFLIHPRPHYGLDIIYDGLCTVLGDEHVVDYPRKPWLHGQKPDQMANYPCTFDRKGREYAREEILERLNEGYFDLVLFGNIHDQLEDDECQSLADAIGTTPVFALDAEDDPAEHWNQLNLAFGEICSAYFKREMLACAEYAAKTYPMPFAYPDHLVAANPPTDRPRPIFWAGHRRFGLRRACLEHIERHFDIDLSQSFDQEQYRQAMLEAQIGLNFFGMGYDTVRYWELPAHRCMLFSERLPIRIPHDFVDGKSAVFFDTARDMTDKLTYYLAHPEEAQAIAAAGHAHLRQYHTASARAMQLLGWMDAALRK